VENQEPKFFTLSLSLFWRRKSGRKENLKASERERVDAEVCVSMPVLV
jgi:hypothetical protein